MQQQFSNSPDLSEQMSTIHDAHWRLLGEADEWANETNSEVDLDVFALIIASAEYWNPHTSITYWNRVRVACFMWLVGDYCMAELNRDKPDGLDEQMWLFLSFLYETDWLSDDSDRISALRQPLRCHGDLDANGYYAGTPQPMRHGCLCFKPFKGKSHGHTMEGERW